MSSMGGPGGGHFVEPDAPTQVQHQCLSFRPPPARSEPIMGAVAGERHTVEAAYAAALFDQSRQCRSRFHRVNIGRLPGVSTYEDAQCLRGLASFKWS